MALGRPRRAPWPEQASSAGGAHHEHHPLDIVRIPVLSDNYVWLMCEPQSGDGGLVDLAVARPRARKGRGHGVVAVGMAGGDPVAVFAEVRCRKDVFPPRVVSGGPGSRRLPGP
jgi:hypothetical protein